MDRRGRALAKDWLQALKSGKYKQGQERLVTPKGEYCCLGVLCDVALKRGIVEGRWQADGFVIPRANVVDPLDYDYYDAVPPKEVWHGLLLSEEGIVPGSFAAIMEALKEHGLGEGIDTTHFEDKNPLLTEFNDHGATFDDIAFIISHFLVGGRDASGR